MLLNTNDEGRAFASVSDVYDEARHWSYRITRASLGTTTGLIVLAMLAKIPGRGPAFDQTADILTDGSVATRVRDAKMQWITTTIGSIEAVRDNMRRLADHCKLGDVDREAMFEELRKWVRKDFRARSEN